MKCALYILSFVLTLSQLGSTSTALNTIAGSDGSVHRSSHYTDPSKPSQCISRKTLPGSLNWRWPDGTSVSIYYLRGHFTVAEIDAFAESIKSWNDALAEMNSDIRFTVAGERDDDDVKQGASIVFGRGKPLGKDRLGEIKLKSAANGAVHLVATVKPVVTDIGALKSLMVHELGHSMGLADCYECKRGTTAMAAFKEKNEGNDVFSPSECDKYVVATALRRSLDTAAHVRQPRVESIRPAPVITSPVGP